MSQSFLKTTVVTGSMLATGSAFVAPAAQSPSVAARVSTDVAGAQVQAPGAAGAADTGYASLGLAAGLAGAAAVVGARRAARPQTRSGKAVAVMQAYDSELGVTMPMKYFDPLGLAKAPSDAADFRRRREAEIKNGRVAMFAAMGYIAPEYFRWPGYLSPSEGIKFTDVPNGVAALSKVPAEGWAQIGCFIAFLELFPLRQDANRLPGDFATCGKLGVPWFFVAGRNGSDADPVANKRGLESEINNGRLAMVAITGMISQNGFFGSTENMWLPSGAFETELGVQAPVGFFDPLKLSADGDVANFKRRRAVELKHGRVCMLATLGYLVPEYFKFPGYLSPSLGLKFADVPNGIAAVSKVPIEGWLQIGLFLGHMEGKFFRQDPKRAPGDFEGYGFLGVGKNFIFNFNPATIADPAVRNRKLNAEIANGRLAMVALMAMLFQNGTVGSTGPEMWLPSA